MSLREAVFFIRDTTLGAGSAFRSTVVRVFLSCFTVIALVWVAVMMYVSFYYAYMPTVRHSEPVYLQFSSECGNGPDHGLCSYPEANMSLSKGERILMRGQKYQVFLDLEMPHSPVNEKLGMFMVNIRFLTHSGTVVAKTSRSAMLHFKSGLLQSIYTMCLFVPLVFGLTEEKQIVPVKLFENYIDDSYHPAVAVNVAIKAKHIEIYSASLRIEAQFTGIRYILFNWPVTSALVIVSANFIVISFIFFFAYTAFIPELEDESYLATLENETRATEWSPSNARRRHVTSSSRETPHATHIRSPSRNGRSKAKPTHKRPRLKADIRGSVPSSHPQNKSPPQDPDTGGMLRSATFPLFRWGETDECPDGPGQGGPHSDALVHSAPGAVGGSDPSDPGGVPVGSSEDHARFSGDIIKDSRDVRDPKLFKAYTGMAARRGGRQHRAVRSDEELQSSRTLRTSRSLTDAMSLEDGACGRGGTPLRSYSYESGMRARESRDMYTIIDPESGKRYHSYAAYRERESGTSGKSFKIGSTDASEEERTLTSDAENVRERHNSQGDTTLGSQRSLSYRVPDGAPSSSAPTVDGPGTSASKEGAGLSNANGTSLRKRPLKKGRPKIGLSFRKMLSLR